MTTRATPAEVDERDLYPLHEEDDVTEVTFHEREVRYLRNAIAAQHPDWFVTGNVGIYWVRGNFSLYAAPDVFVARASLPQPDPRVYLLWRDPPVIFAAEIGSRSTQRADEGPELEIYGREMRVAEYLYADPPKGDVRLWRLGTRDYEPVAAEPGGRFRSEQLGLEFGLEDDFLWVYTLEGERFGTHEEEVRRRREAETRAVELERQLAELQSRRRRRQRPDSSEG
jgi:Uma2 family endonuclease